ncbi:hypothetical protein C8Q74DRAFT_1222634 [Fomes fomentarius]|nr:hypothetical protein C8Q74DRAFT_1222634 [Fomes fomentarius]
MLCFALSAQDPYLSSAELHIPYEEVKDSERWIHGICDASCRTLTHLGVTINRLIFHWASDARSEGWQAIFGSIAMCTALHSLSIRYQPKEELKGYSSGPQEMGGEDPSMQEPDPLASSRHGRYPQLDAFELALRGFAVDVLEEHPDVTPFRELSRTFERPHFAHLRTISVTVEAIPSFLLDLDAHYITIGGRREDMDFMQRWRGWDEYGWDDQGCLRTQLKDKHEGVAISVDLVHMSFGMAKKTDPAE